jgi:hypothetical protein
MLKVVVSIFLIKYESSALTIQTNSYNMLILMLLIYIASIFRRRYTMNNELFNAYTNYILIATIIQIGASESQIAMRAGYYYFIFIILLLPEIILNYRKINIRTGLAITTVLLCIAFYYLTTSSSALNPYLFYWE